MPLGSFEKKLTQYKPTDGDNLSSSELSRSYWIVTHKVFFRTLGIGILVVIDVLLLSYAIWGFVTYLTVGRTREQAALVSLSKRAAENRVPFQKSVAAVPLTIGEAQVFDGGNSVFDFVSEVQNSNTNWYALVTFNFHIENASSTPMRTVNVLPGERKYLTSLGQKYADQSITAATLNVAAIKWQRIDAHAFPDVEGFMKSRLQFEATDSALAPLNPEQAAGNQITFTFKNNSAYNFWAVPVQIELLRGGALQGVEETIIRQLRTGQSRVVELRNFVPNLIADEVVVLPSIDVFDDTVYMKQ